MSIIIIILTAISFIVLKLQFTKLKNWMCVSEGFGKSGHNYIAGLNTYWKTLKRIQNDEENSKVVQAKRSRKQ